METPNEQELIVDTYERRKRLLSNLAQAQKQKEEKLEQERLTVGLLTKEKLLSRSNVSHPSSVSVADISSMGLFGIIAEELEEFENITKIIATDNRLNLKVFGEMPYLTELNMACNLISKLEDMEGLFLHLESLDLSFNQLRSSVFTVLSQLPNIQRLVLQDNDINGIPESIKGFQSLRILNLDRNRIRSNSQALFTLSSLPNLIVLSLNDNFIISFSDFKYFGVDRFPALEQLHIARNNIPTLEELAGVGRFPKLTSLWVDGNPFVRQAIVDLAKNGAENSSLAAFEKRHGVSFMDLIVNKNRHQRREAANVSPVHHTRYHPKMASKYKVDELALRSPKKLTKNQIKKLIEEEHKLVLIHDADNGIHEIHEEEEEEIITTNDRQPIILPDADDALKATFMTGVNISEIVSEIKTQITSNIPAPMSEAERKMRLAIDAEDGSADILSDLKLPNLIQESCRSLEQLIENPLFIWRQVVNFAPNKIKPTMICPKPKVSKKSTRTKSASKPAGQLATLYLIMEQIDARMERIEENLKNL